MNSYRLIDGIEKKRLETCVENDESKRKRYNNP